MTVTIESICAAMAASDEWTDENKEGFYAVFRHPERLSRRCNYDSGLCYYAVCNNLFKLLVWLHANGCNLAGRVMLEKAEFVGNIEMLEWLVMNNVGTVPRDADCSVGYSISHPNPDVHREKSISLQTWVREGNGESCEAATAAYMRRYSAHVKSACPTR